MIHKNALKDVSLPRAHQNERIANKSTDPSSKSLQHISLHRLDTPLKNNQKTNNKKQKQKTSTPKQIKNNNSNNNRKRKTKQEQNTINQSTN